MQFNTSAGGFFITGTDTDIGKTFCACQIIQRLIQQQIPVAPRKPIASGCIWQNGELISEDALALQQAAQSNEDLANICRYCFEPAISPARAAANAVNSAQNPAQPGLVIQDLIVACEVPVEKFAVIEGAGGFLSPLATDGLNADLAVALQLPVILVVGNRLGCLNHALLTIEAIQARGLRIECLILNDLSPTADQANLQDLQQLSQLPVFHQKFI